MPKRRDRKKSVFLSHNGADKHFVRRVHKELQKCQIPNWLDEAEILPGDSLIEKIDQAIARIDYLAVFVSESSIESRWVKKEVSIALTREIGGHRIRVVPVIIGTLKDSQIPAMIADKYYIDFRDPSPFEKGWHELHMLLDEEYKEFINGALAMLEAPDETATALEGILSAAGHEVDGIAQLYHYVGVYKAMGIEIEKVFEMYEHTPEGAVDRLARDLRRQLPYPLWAHLASPEILTRILRGFGKIA